MKYQYDQGSQPELLSSYQSIYIGSIQAFMPPIQIIYTVTGGGGASLHSQYGEFGSAHQYMVVDVLPDNIEMKVVYFFPIKN